MDPYRGHSIRVHKTDGFWMMSVFDEDGKLLSTGASVNRLGSDEENKQKSLEFSREVSKWLGIDNVEVQDG